MKRSHLAILVGVELGLCFFVLLVPISIPCIFKRVLSIPCPGCGMTRAFYAFLEGHFLEAFTDNILFYPFMGFLIFFPIRLIVALKRGEKSVSFSFFKRPSVIAVIILFLLISEFYNVINGL